MASARRPARLPVSARGVLPKPPQSLLRRLARASAAAARARRGRLKDPFACFLPAMAATAERARPRADPGPSRAAFAGIFSVTLLALLAVGAVLPVLPHYVRGPLGAGNVAVGVVIGAFA